MSLDARTSELLVLEVLVPAVLLAFQERMVQTIRKYSQLKHEVLLMRIGASFLAFMETVGYPIMAEKHTQLLVHRSYRAEIGNGGQRYLGLMGTVWRKAI